MDTKQKSASQRRRARTAQRAASAGEKRGGRSPEARSRAPSQTRRRNTTAQKAQQQIVYTPPKPFNRNRFLLRLATVVAVVLALTMGISIFFKVRVVTVSGAQKYTPWEIRQASGIQDGENLLSLSKFRAGARITSALPYVESVRIGIKLPDTVNIEIKELSVVYAVQDQSDGWWLINSSGGVVEQADNASAGQQTKILGVRIAFPTVGAKAAAVEQQTPAPNVTSTDPSASAPVAPQVTVLGSERLNAALSVLQYLEENGMIGKIVSVDVSNMGSIELWYGQRFQINLGDGTNLSYKISSLAATVRQLGDYASGKLDVSFTYWDEGVGYTPFS